MAYRRTERVRQRLAARHDAIIAAARAIAATDGLGAVQIVPVAARAGIAAGTVYRYFPAKTDLVAALANCESERELAAMRAAAARAPGPLSALAAAMVTFAARAMRHRRLVWALTGEPVDGETDAARRAFRTTLTAELATRIRAAMVGDYLPEGDVDLAAAALTGALIEGIVGPLAPPAADDAGKIRASVQGLTLMLLRALGVIDARARGLVVQTPLPAEEKAA